jgi:hypothetical protein
MTNKTIIGYFSLLILTVLISLSASLAIAQTQAAKPTLPADFPKDIPLYKNATLVSSGFYMDDPKLGKSLIFETGDPVDAVITYYKTQLPANGWTVTKPPYIANPNTITIMKGSRMAMVSPNRKNDKITRIEIILMGQ